MPKCDSACIAVSIATDTCMLGKQLLDWSNFCTNSRNFSEAERPVLMLLRAGMQVFTALLVQLSLKHLPLAETTALVFMSPSLVTLLAGSVLGEKQRFYHWFAIAAGFAGVLLIARPSDVTSGLGVLYALAAALSNAMYQLLTCKLAVSEPPMRQLFYLSLVGAVVMSFAVPEY